MIFTEYTALCESYLTESDNTRVFEYIIGKLNNKAEVDHAYDCLMTRRIV